MGKKTEKQTNKLSFCYSTMKKRDRNTSRAKRESERRIQRHQSAVAIFH